MIEPEKCKDMNDIKTAIDKIETKVMLSILWIFLTLNYIFCDVFSLMYHEDLQQLLSGHVGDMEISQKFLLSFAIIMEIPMAMIVLSRLLKYNLNRLVNIAAGSVLTIVQFGSLFADSNTLHYLFFSAIEISTSSFIIWVSLKWKVCT